MNASDIYHLLGIVAVAVGATWALRSKLDDVKHALTAHVVQDEGRHVNHEGRIVSLEGKRRGRRP